MIVQLSKVEITQIIGAKFCCCLSSSGAVITGKEIMGGKEECRRYCCSGGWFGALDFTFAFKFAPSFIHNVGSKEGGTEHSVGYNVALQPPGIEFGISSSTRQIAKFSVDGGSFDC